MRIQSTLQPPRNRNSATAKALVPRADGSRGVKTEDTVEFADDKVSQTLAGLGSAAALSTVGAAYPSTWLHEMGHAKMIGLMYDGAKPTVEVFPFKGGVTRWQLAPLSDVGKKFGADGARAMVSAAGTLVDMGVATASFGVGFKMRKKHPVVGTALMGFGGLTVLNSIAYAATAVGKNVAELAKSGNDFAGIAVRAGVPPLASIAIMAAILPLEYAALKYLENH